ncbi:hypothetical protein ACLMJK_002793 [Lecanora helva]
MRLQASSLLPLLPLLTAQQINQLPDGQIQAQTMHAPPLLASKPPQSDYESPAPDETAMAVGENHTMKQDSSVSNLWHAPIASGSAHIPFHNAAANATGMYAHPSGTGAPAPALANKNATTPTVVAVLPTGISAGGASGSSNATAPSAGGPKEAGTSAPASPLKGGASGRVRVGGVEVGILGVGVVWLVGVVG